MIGQNNKRRAISEADFLQGHYYGTFLSIKHEKENRRTDDPKQ